MNGIMDKAAGLAYYKECQEEVSNGAYLKELVPSVGKTVGQLAARLTLDSKSLDQRFIRGGGAFLSASEQNGKIAQHIYKQCVEIGVPFHLFDEGCVIFNNGRTAMYHGVWAISAMRQQAMKHGHPLIGSDFKVAFHVPRIETILSEQNTYLEEMGDGDGCMYTSMALSEVYGMEDRKGFFFYPRAKAIIYGAEVTYSIDGTYQRPVYFCVDLSKTKLKNSAGPTAYGGYQPKTVRTKAIRHAMQNFYGPLLPIQTVDEPKDASVGLEALSMPEDEQNNTIAAYKAERKAILLQGVAS